MTEVKDQSQPIFLRELQIRNFKGIDQLDIKFPPPLMRYETDVMLLGSRNGIGKTSVMEAIALLFMCVFVKEEANQELRNLILSHTAHFVQAGKKHASIEGIFEIGNEQLNIQMTFSSGIIGYDDPETVQSKSNFSIDISPSILQERFRSLLGQNIEPLVLPQFAYFHSYRKVQEGHLAMSDLIEKGTELKGSSASKSAPSQFKIEILKTLMSLKGLFENLDSSESDRTMEVLNDLMREFAGGYIKDLRLDAMHNSLDIRVTPLQGGDTFTFDGLSSGQKEIISTLFLIWRYTKDQPGMILIDEPELHLNAEWHRKFIRHLHKMAPLNQYIIATHSEDMFASVDTDRRLILVNKAAGDSHVQ